VSGVLFAISIAIKLTRDFTHNPWKLQAPLQQEMILVKATMSNFSQCAIPISVNI
jgi:hypothetical protein